MAWWRGNGEENNESQHLAYEIININEISQ
jgi:hypothetical protein